MSRLTVCNLVFTEMPGNWGWWCEVCFFLLFLSAWVSNTMNLCFAVFSQSKFLYIFVPLCYLTETGFTVIMNIIHYLFEITNSLTKFANVRKKLQGNKLIKQSQFFKVLFICYSIFVCSPFFHTSCQLFYFLT